MSVFAHQFQRLDDYEDAFKSCEVIMKQLTELKEKSQLYNKREQLLGIEKTDYQALDNLVKEFEPQHLLWSCAYKFNALEQHVMQDDFKRVNAQETVEQTD